MKKTITKIINSLKVAYLANKNSFLFPNTVKTVPVLRFLKEKSMILAYELHDTGSMIVYINAAGFRPLIKNTKVQLLNNKIFFAAYSDYNKKTMNPYIVDIFSTSYGLMDQNDLKKSHVGGIFLCTIYLS